MSIRERTYPQEREVPVLIGHCVDARYVWNMALAQRNLWVRGRVNRHPPYVLACSSVQTVNAASRHDDTSCITVEHHRVEGLRRFRTTCYPK